MTRLHAWISRPHSADVAGELSGVTHAVRLATQSFVPDSLTPHAPSGVGPRLSDGHRRPVPRVTGARRPRSCSTHIQLRGVQGRSSSRDEGQSNTSSESVCRREDNLRVVRHSRRVCVCGSLDGRSLVQLLRRWSTEQPIDPLRHARIRDHRNVLDDRDVCQTRNWIHVADARQSHLVISRHNPCRSSYSTSAGDEQARSVAEVVCRCEGSFGRQLDVRLKAPVLGRLRWAMKSTTKLRSHTKCHPNGSDIETFIARVINAAQRTRQVVK